MSLFRHRHATKKLGTELQEHNQRLGSGRNLNQLAKSKVARSSFVAKTQEMRWLTPKFEKFRPSLYLMGVVLLGLRLLQTSFIALVRTQIVQAAIVCFVTLASALVQTQLSPYRRNSDNHVALLVQCLVFLWTFILLLRIAGVFVRPVAATVVGTLLCIATVAVFVTALILADADRRIERRFIGDTAEGSSDDDVSDAAAEGQRTANRHHTTMKKAKQVRAEDAHPLAKRRT